MSDMITIAVSKGRIYDEAIPLLAKLDIVPKDDPKKSRKLILETNQKNIQSQSLNLASEISSFIDSSSSCIPSV